MQLIPTTAIAYLAAAGATNPTNIIFPSLISTACAVITAVLAAKFFEKMSSTRFVIAIDDATERADIANIQLDCFKLYILWEVLKQHFM